MSCAEMAELIEMPFGSCTCVGPKEPCIRFWPGSPQGKGQFWGHLPASCEVQGIPGMRQSYLLGGRTDVACHCRYCTSFCTTL